MTKPFVKGNIELAVEALRAACGFPNSESGTENFLSLLLDAAIHTDMDVEESHDGGLCLNCDAVIAGYLEEMLIADKLADMALRN